MNNDILPFENPVSNTSFIKVIGVGGGGSNAVNYMCSLGITGVDFVVCNTDAQALANSPVPVKIHLGQSLTEGLGAGNKPSRGRDAAIESIKDVESVLKNHTKMVFITAGMGGGTGTGAAPIIAQKARELGILTVGIVTIPFRFEGKVRINQAIDGIAEMEKYVDSLLIIKNEKLREMYGDLKIKEAFSKADDVLATAAKGIAEIISEHYDVNVDFADVVTIMGDGGVSLMGSGEAEGENRALVAVQSALESPLLDNNDIKGARNILLNIKGGADDAPSMDEVGRIADYITDLVGGSNDNLIWGTGIDNRLGAKISVTIVATGFASNDMFEPAQAQPTNKQLLTIADDFEDDYASDDFEDDFDEDGFVYNKGPKTDANARVIEFDAVDREKERRIQALYPPVPKKSDVLEIEDTAKKMSNDSFIFPAQNFNDESVIDQLERVPAYKRRK